MSNQGNFTSGGFLKTFCLSRGQNRTIYLERLEQGERGFFCRPKGYPQPWTPLKCRWPPPPDPPRPPRVPAVPTRPFVVPKAAAGSSSPCSGRSWTCGASRGGCPRSSSRVCPPAAGAPTKTAAALRGARTGRAAAGSAGQRPGPREVTASPARLLGSWAHLSCFGSSVSVKPPTRVSCRSRICINACRQASGTLSPREDNAGTSRNWKASLEPESLQGSKLLTEANCAQWRKTGLEDYIIRLPQGTQGPGSLRN